MKDILIVIYGGRADDQGVGRKTIVRRKKGGTID